MTALFPPGLARLSLLLALGLGPAAAWARSHPAKAPASPVVVELFTAQGCSSCQAANGLIAKLAERPGIIALTWSVDYWDYLGWQDTFAQPEFVVRQKAYARHLGPRDVYTPQVVVNGAAQTSGDDAAGVEALIRDSKTQTSRPPRIRFLPGGGIAVGAGQRPPRSAEVWLIRYDPKEQDVLVKAGDNRGASVAETKVVRQMVRLGAWKGAPVSFKAPAADEGLASVVILQVTHGGPVLAARETKPIAGKKA